MVYLLGQIKIKDKIKWEEYKSKVSQTLAPYNSELVMRGELLEILSGYCEFENIVIIKFPNRDKLNGWYNSKDYQKLIPLRKEAADMNLMSFKENL
jgi:uncharacterized protein (DUF1330 family)